MAALSFMSFPGRCAALAAIAVVAGSTLFASAAFANYVARKSFDRQVVAADVFVVGSMVGEKGPCPGGPSYGCSTVRIVRSLKGDAPGEIILSDGGIAELDPRCCEPGHVYAMALIRTPSGFYSSTNASMAIYDLGTDWTPSMVARQPNVAAPFRPLTFDQQVVEADVFVVARRTGEVHPCSNQGAYDRACVSFTVVRTMKGEIAQTFEAPVETSIFSFESRETIYHPYGYAEVGGVYVLALRTGSGWVAPVSLDSVHRLSSP